MYQLWEFDAEGLFWQELHRKREEKRRENERMAGEEMAMLKESGKVGRPRKGNVVRKKTRAKATRGGSSSDGETEQRKISTGGSRTCNIDDLFQVRLHTYLLAYSSCVPTQRSSSEVECRTRHRDSPGSNPPFATVL